MNVDVARLLKALGIDAVRQGRELWARCPYPGHETDSEPSWSIADGGERNGLNNCFGCGASGNVVELVMEVVGLSGYSAAISWIKERGLDFDEPTLPSIELSVSKPSSARMRLKEPRRLIKEFDRWPSSAVEYVRCRDVRPWQIAKWGIATAVDGEVAGRVWIPIRDSNGTLLDWTARTWCDDDDTHKCPTGGGLPGAIFGEEGWPTATIRLTRRLVICEGAFDAMACERAGAEYVAALGGVSKYDKWKAMKISIWGSVVIAVDPDTAGDRISEILRMLGRVPCIEEARRLELPRGVDCDELWRDDPQRLVDLLK